MQLLQPISFSRTDLDLYLRGRGWHYEALASWDVYIPPQYDGDKEIVLPKSGLPTDFIMSAHAALGCLSEYYEEEDIATLELTVKHYDRDILQLRTEAADYGIPLDVAGPQIENFRKLVLDAATNELKPRLQTTNPPDRAKSLQSEFTFGHTSKGSFVVTILSGKTKSFSPFYYQRDLFPRPEQPTPSAQATLSRRVTERIVGGIVEIEKTGEVGDYITGYNRNMCADLIKIVDTNRPELRMFWSPLVPPKEEIANVRRVSLGESLLPVLLAATNKTTHEEDQARRFTGKVLSLRNEDPTNVDFSGQIVLQVTEGEKERKIHVPLPHDDYTKALEQHGIGKLVEVRGRLVREGTFYSLTDVHGFKRWEPLLPE